MTQQDDTRPFGDKMRTLLRKHRTLVFVLVALVLAWVFLTWLGSLYAPFSPEVLLSRESAEAAKQYLLSFGAAAPALFVSLQALQVIIAPIPGQATGFIGGYVFGWLEGVAITMVGLTIGSVIVFVLSRKFGQRFVEKLNGAEAVKDFEELFLNDRNSAGAGAYGKSKDAFRSHGLLTFFIIMLLPALPDDLVCFMAGLTRIPIWQLTLATILGRFPGMLVLSMVGDGFSKAQSNLMFAIFIGVAVVLTALYFWKRQVIEAAMKRLARIK